MSDTLLPTVLIDPNVEVNIILREIYYRLQGYYQNAEQLLKAAKREGHNFSIDNVKKFLHKQILWQRYRISRAIVPRVSCKFRGFWPVPGGTLHGGILYIGGYRIFKIPGVHAMYNTRVFIIY